MKHNRLNKPTSEPPALSEELNTAGICDNNFGQAEAPKIARRYFSREVDADDASFLLRNAPLLWRN